MIERHYKLLSGNDHSLNEIYIRNAELYHDMGNHLNLLYQLLQENDIDGAKEYIKKISEPVLSLSKKEWTGTDMVDAIINSKVQEMEELNIIPDINVEFPKNSTILLNDICTVLSNLLDNAVEAVDRLEEDNRAVHFTMRIVRFFLFIQVINPCTRNGQFETFPATTKENTFLHGWGLQSVNDVVKRYGGTMECENRSYEFAVNIMLPFDEK